MSGATEPLQHRVSPVLIGRADLLALALRRWQEARNGRGQVLLVAGEAGIGKTRLLGELVREVGGEARLITAVAYPRDAETAGALLLDLADDLRRSGEIESANRIRERIVAEPEGDRSRHRRLVVGDVVALLREQLASGPVLVRIEDLHWADELTLEVLERIAGGLVGTPALIVASIRTDELYPRTALAAWRARLLEQRRAEEVRPARLQAADTAALAETLTGRPLSASFLEELQLHSDGIPLHVEELLAAGSPTFLPDTIAEAVRTRSGLLRPATREVAAAAAVIGRSFALELLEAVSADAGGDVDSALRELVDRNLVAPAAGGEFVFRHALICDAVYADITPRHRRELHAAAASAAQAAGFHPAYLSAQFERAGLREEAYRYSLAAAEDAIRVSAHREAAELYRRARRTHPVSSSPREEAHLRELLAVELAAIDENEEAASELAEAIGILRASGDELGAARLTPRLMAVRHLLGDGLATRAALAAQALTLIDDLGTGDAEVRAELLAALAAAYMLDRRLDEAAQYAREAAALTTSPTLQLNLDATLGSVDVFGGRSAEGWDRLQSTIDRATRDAAEAEAARAYRMAGTSASVLMDYDRAERTIAAGLDYTARTERWNDHHYLTAHLAHVRWATGDWRDSEVAARRALADGRGGVTTRITATYVLGYLALGRGQRGDARRHLEAAYAEGSAMGELQRLSPPLWGLAELALAEDRVTACIGLTEEGLAASERVADAAYLFPFLLTGVRARLAARDLTAARNWFARAGALLELRALPGTLTWISHAEALLELAEGHTGRARELLEAAEEGWRGSRRFWEGTQALLDLARCADRSRRAGMASEYRAKAGARAAASGASALADAASLGEPAADPDSSLLSPRELQVAMLVAAGATNREIADKLTISPKTASSHIEHILSKLRASRRSEIATWATRLTMR